MLLFLISQALAADTAFHVAGYGYAGLEVPVDGDAPAFNEASFNPIFLWRQGDRLLIESELAFVAGEEGLEVMLEYATLDIATRGPVISVGKFLSPAGQFISRQHPAWINRMPDFPLPQRLGVVPMGHIGVMAQQTFHVGPRQKLSGVLWVDNGLSGDAGGPDLMAKVGDDDWDKGLGGRLGVFVLPQVEIGASGYTAGYADGERYSLAMGDFSVTPGSFDVRGEYIYATWGSSSFQGAWASAAWRLRQVEKLSWLEPVVRAGFASGDLPKPAGTMEMGGGIQVLPLAGTHAESDLELGSDPVYELCGGASAYLRETVALRLAYVHNVEVWDPMVRASVTLGY